MEFLKAKGFTESEIAKIIDKYDETLDSFEFISDNVCDVIDYLREYGIEDIPYLMLEKIDIFYLPVSKLKEIFSHYDKEYIINELSTDASVFDELE